MIRTDKWGKNKQISTVEKFQIICVNPPSLRRYNIVPHFLLVCCRYWLPSRRFHMNSRRQVILQCRNLTNSPDFHHFNEMSYFCTRTPSWISHYIYFSCLLRLPLSWLWQPLRVFCFFFGDLDWFEECWSGIFRMCLYWNVCDVFLVIRLMRVLERRPQMKSAIFIS